MRILGVDPGSQLTGYGIIETQANRLVCVHSGCIRIKLSDLAGRLLQIYTALGEITDEFKPHEVAVESVFVHRNVESALKLGQARGAAITSVAMRGLPVIEYTPSTIKKTVAGRGNATKRQVQHMVKALLNLPGKQQADAADALAVAICHANSRGALRNSGQLAVRRGGRWRLKGLP
ncbi:MAG: crossover junction endodeoxyribonuclease RuvC [Gammaproteobacteria bacterium]|nr:crossover junction endodeoxyribonuclease RuvC [Gammaproteobacteria bacterium]